MRYKCSMTSNLDLRVKQLSAACRETLLEALGIELTELTPERVAGTMPVSRKTIQPFGLLHGGASIALAESLASIGGFLNLSTDDLQVVGTNISANHLRSARSGTVSGIAVPRHIGRSSQLWQIEILRDDGKLLSLVECTLRVVSRERSES